ncbi:MAG: MATE family efflux transporter [Eubacteriales bacterium]|nr:MATE family efflux transporter [Eubacteriales bacterium]
MEQTKRNPITEGKIGREMLLFFFPILFGSFFQQIYNTADALIVGRFLGKIALSAVGGSSGMIVMLVIGFFVGLSSGATVLVAQFYGAGDEEEVSKAVHTVFLFSLLCGFAVMVLGIVMTPAILRLMNAPEETMEMSIIYLRVYFTGMIGNLIYNVGSGILRAVGDSKRPFLFLVVSCILNIILDLLFIIVFRMGVFGAAFATILSQLVSAILVIYVMIRQKASYQLHLKKLHMDLAILKKMIQVGLPAGMQAVMYGVSNIIIQVGVNGLGTDYVAAWATYYKIDGVFWMTVNAFGIAAATFVGQNYGAAKMGRVKQSIVICMLQTITASVCLSVAFYVVSPWIFPLFSTDSGVIKIGVAMMRYLTRFYVLYVSIEILSGALRGVGDTFIPMVISGVLVCLLRSVWILFVMPLHNNMYTMMISYPISWSICSVAFFVYLLCFSKLRLSVFSKKK